MTRILSAVSRLRAARLAAERELERLRALLDASD